MHETLQQLPALLGVVIGVVTTFALTSIGERARWRRSQDVRWDAARLEAYVSYGNAVKRVVHVATCLAAARGLPHSSEPVPLEQGQLELAAATAERTARWESVLLLGHPDTIAAGRAWHQAVWRLEFYARGLLRDRDGWADALDDFERMREGFHRAARNDLGVGGEVLTTSWPPPWYERLSDEERAAVAAATDPRP
ncbi:hypothetical protein ACPPVO_50420 [Dactylosporangium sp. McL0621]|uniref:hypothetical protein n=1 Tax=Dactylosporangium sp. McL0621 TaxID=3415678 RepID=UPI003CE9124F